MSKKQIKEDEEIEVIASSGNVYSDTGYPNPEEAKAKAELAILISDAIKRKKLTQKKAAELIGVDQPKVSAIIRGQLSGFSIDRLFRFLMALGMDIIIEAKPHHSRTTPANIQVIQQQPFKTRTAAA
jgi:predicted XRE-type DNA-binding protein